MPALMATLARVSVQRAVGHEFLKGRPRHLGKRKAIMGELLLLLGVFAATFALGILLILRVPPRLHTPLMSMTNAVSGITVLGALLLFAEELSATTSVLAAVAVVAGAFNLVGGFAVTDRMLRFFQKRGDRHE
jgi:NAD(P) transhydrogenase subunit alpha